MGESWLLVSVSSGADASLRVAVWRHLRKLGAVYLQSSVCLLPTREEVAASVTALVERVRAGGGQARVQRIDFTEDADAFEVIAEQRADRDAEYGEILDRVPAFLAELETETARGRTTYVEVEESEVDLDRFERWLAAITARDYFAASGRQVAREAVERCRQALSTFEAAAVAADTRNEELGSRSRRGVEVVDAPAEGTAG